LSQQDDDFFVRGWCQFPHDDHLLNWVNHSVEPARATVAAVELSHWLRCGRTWFVGVNALPSLVGSEMCIRDSALVALRPHLVCRR